MQRRWLCLAASGGLLVATCKPSAQEPRAEADAVVQAPDPVAGNSQDYAIAVRRVFLEATASGFDARFEIGNLGKGIVSVASNGSATKPEAALIVEVFKDGVWKRAPSASEVATEFIELWPGATEYGRTMIPSDGTWARVFLKARGLVSRKDGATVEGVVEVSGDAFRLLASR